MCLEESSCPFTRDALNFRLTKNICRAAPPSSVHASPLPQPSTLRHVTLCSIKATCTIVLLNFCFLCPYLCLFWGFLFCLLLSSVRRVRLPFLLLMGDKTNGLETSIFVLAWVSGDEHQRLQKVRTERGKTRASLTSSFQLHNFLFFLPPDDLTCRVSECERELWSASLFCPLMWTFSHQSCQRTTIPAGVSILSWYMHRFTLRPVTLMY